MMNDTIHITCGFDSKYTRFAGVLLVSIFENNKSEHFCCHLMGLDLLDSDKRDLKEIADKYGQKVKFYDMDESLFKDFHVTKQWNIATYFRLVLPTLLDEKVPRIIYFDCDMICRGSIRQLYDIDLKGKVIGACEDHVISPRMSLCYQNGINANNFYFNAGMLLIDCKVWRANDTTSKCMEYLKKNHPMHLDQDTLNAVLQDKWFHLAYRWNFMADFHGAYFHKKEFEMDMTKSYPYYPVIIHFTGVKPWHHANRSPYKLDFFRYQSLTKWGGIIPRHTLKEKIVQAIRVLFDKVGLKKINPYKRYDFSFNK